MKQHPQIILKNIREENQNKLSFYQQRGGYEALKKALTMDPLAVIDEVKKSNLRGRGGAGFPTGMKWGFVPRTTGKPTYLVCNADESEPGTFKDRLLIEKDPHLLLEGILCSAYALNATVCYIYIRGEYAYPYQRLNEALLEARAANIIGKSILGSNFSCEVYIHRGAGAYICGEETAQLNSIEGKKGQPRLKPPFPAVSGLYGCPTVINNCESIANVPWIILNGGEAYAKLGVPNSSGTKLISVSGHINKPGIYEVEMGYNLLEFINNECGGMKNGKAIKAVIPGGSSVNILRGDELEGVNLDYDSLKNAGSSLGCAGFMVLDETVDMVEVALNLSHFYAHESCGQCTPCREGGHWIQKIFKRIARGGGLPGDLELIDNICNQIGGHTICAFGDTMILPYKSIIKKFRNEFKERILQNIKDKETLNFELGGH